MKLGRALVDPHYDIIESVLRRTFYDQPVTDEEIARYNEAIRHWTRRACRRRACPHRADTCRFANPNLDWVNVLGFVNLCELLSLDRPPKTFSTLDATWLRRPGHYNG